jgi:hypothetical protein
MAIFDMRCLKSVPNDDQVANGCSNQNEACSAIWASRFRLELLNSNEPSTEKRNPYLPLLGSWALAAIVQ